MVWSCSSVYGVCGAVALRCTCAVPLGAVRCVCAVLWRSRAAVCDVPCGAVGGVALRVCCAVRCGVVRVCCAVAWSCCSVCGAVRCVCVLCWSVRWCSALPTPSISCFDVSYITHPLIRMDRRDVRIMLMYRR